MWALCRREHGLSWAEFQELTLAEFEAFEDRRAIDLRHSRFNAALVASTIYNVNRHTDSGPLSPFDFIAGFETDPEDARKAELRQSVKRAVILAMTQLPKGVTRAQVLAEKGRMIERMKASGQVEDAEELFREAFPDLL